VFPKWAWSGSHEQFLHCGLRKFRNSKSSVYRWYTQLDIVGLFMTPIRQWRRLGWVHMFITHRPTLTLQLHNFHLFRICRTSSFCTAAWQLVRFQLTRRIARSLDDSWATFEKTIKSPYFRNRLTDFDEILQGDANGQPTGDRPLKFSNFQKPRWHLENSRYLRNEIWYATAKWVS